MNGAMAGEVLDVAWFAGAITKLDRKWADMWSQMEEEFTQIKVKQGEGFEKIKHAQAQQNEQNEAALKKLNKQLEGEASKASERAGNFNQRLESITRNQHAIIASQDEQKKNLADLKASIIQDIQHKLEAATGAVQEACKATLAHQVSNADTYSDRAARVTREANRTYKDLPNYHGMEKKATTQRPAATQTDGVLERVYVNDLHTQPVGAVKRALRVEISSWKKQNDMRDEQTEQDESSPDIDAVRYLNQFGTPDAPLMEIACTKDSKDSVIHFFTESNIKVWPDTINPLMAPDIATEDNSMIAIKLHHGHTITVLNAWWKAPHYVQNSDTAAYYMKLITQTVCTSGYLYAWPPHIIGISIDARGVTNPKENPKIDFEYAQGYNAPTDHNNNNRTIAVRSFSTGGALPQ